MSGAQDGGDADHHPMDAAETAEVSANEHVSTAKSSFRRALDVQGRRSHVLETAPRNEVSAESSIAAARKSFGSDHALVSTALASPFRLVASFGSAETALECALAISSAARGPFVSALVRLVTAPVPSGTLPIIFWTDPFTSSNTEAAGWGLGRASPSARLPKELVPVLTELALTKNVIARTSLVGARTRVTAAHASVTAPRALTEDARTRSSAAPTPVSAAFATSWRARTLAASSAPA